MFTRHVSPEKPGGQSHVKELFPSLQTPPFLQGLFWQSSSLVSHCCPTKPDGQTHPTPIAEAFEKQTPPFKQGVKEEVQLKLPAGAAKIEQSRPRNTSMQWSWLDIIPRQENCLEEAHLYGRWRNMIRLATTRLETELPNSSSWHQFT
jgi:hypothetical protein